MKWFRIRIDRWGTWWLDYWHGKMVDPTQFRYYRCDGCKGIITWNTIARGGCACGLSMKIRPAVLSGWEKFTLLVLPWWGGKVRTWDNQ